MTTPDQQGQDLEQTAPAEAPAPPVVPSVQNQPEEQSPYYLQVDDLDEEREPSAGLSFPLVAPFHLSGPMPAVQVAQAHTVEPTTQGKTQRFPRLLIAGIIALVVIVVLGWLTISVFAQATPPLATNGGTPSPTTRHTANTPATRPLRTPSPTPTLTMTPGGASENWVPQSLPPGWAAAGLTLGDALFAMRTAWTFTDREMSLDYRNVGTRGAHSGTFTAAVFILTANAKIRFQQNDVRVIDNTLFDAVTTHQLIQAVVNETPRLVQFQVQGQQQFAWIDVSFQLWQSQLNDQGQRIEGLEMDPTTNGPRTHHMEVLLLRVQPGTQGPNAPMGGTGWLVENYGLDLAGGGLLAIVEPA